MAAKETVEGAPGNEGSLTFCSSAGGREAAAAGVRLWRLKGKAGVSPDEVPRLLSVPASLKHSQTRLRKTAVGRPCGLAAGDSLVAEQGHEAVTRKGSPPPWRLTSASVLRACVPSAVPGAALSPGPLPAALPGSLLATD